MFLNMDNSLTIHVRRMMSLAIELIKLNPVLSEEIGTVNVKGDKTIKMDVKIEKTIIDYIKKNDIPANIFSEEIGTIKYHSKPKYLIAFDPLDGSTNYKIGKNLYPYGFLIAIYDGLTPRLKDVIVSGAVECSHNLSWIYENNHTSDLNGNLIRLKNDWVRDKHTPVFLDLYYRDGYLTYNPLAEKLFIRNMGSTIGNLSYVLENISAGMGGVCMRPEEIGAIVSLIKGAGGIAVNHRGKDLGEESFSPNKTYQILAGSKNVIEFAVKNLQQRS